MTIQSKIKHIIVYQAKTGAIELRGDSNHETIWASLDQIANIFERDKSVISRHINNIFKDGELKRNAVVAFFATTAADGKTYQVEYFNLDVILSVGYRVNSKKAILFRQWSTQILRRYIVEGYTINPQRIAANYNEFMIAVADIKKLLPADNIIDGFSVLELISAFAETWLSLESYDKDELSVKGTSKRTIALTATQLDKALTEFKAVLVTRGLASELFGLEKQPGAIAGIVGNVMQSFGGQPVYPTIEAKAAHLLYFVIKNHPFTDGNKRSGAYAFVWFLHRARLLNRNKLTPSALTALTLLIAESAPKNKERMIGLVLRLLKK
jgi:hypothetical protein